MHKEKRTGRNYLTKAPLFTSRKKFALVPPRPGNIFEVSIFGGLFEGKSDGAFFAELGDPQVSLALRYNTLKGSGHIVSRHVGTRGMCFSKYCTVKTDFEQGTRPLSVAALVVFSPPSKDQTAKFLQKKRSRHCNSSIILDAVRGYREEYCVLGRY